MKKHISLKHIFSEYLQTNALISLNNSIELLALGRKLGYRMVLLCFPSSVRYTFRCAQVLNFFKYLLIMKKHHGETYVVKYLKACQLCLQKAIAKDQISSLRALEAELPLPRITRSKLPRFIPMLDRRAIMAGNPSVIRWWLSLFSVYRVISIPGNLKLSTITDGFTGNESYTRFLEKQSSLFVKKVFANSTEYISMKPVKLLLLETSSPSFRVSWAGLIADFELFINSFGVKTIRLFLTKFPNKNFSKFVDSLERLYESDACRKTTYVSGLPFHKGPPLIKDSGLRLGQLSIKSEAAGKERVFALVDIWTQMLLKPIHSYLFDFLKVLPNDGTFDQTASVHRCREKVKISGASFGYDLSAATDRLPLSLQKAIISQIFGSEIGDAWARILVDRDYFLKIPNVREEVALRYAVGQPMGALSSWASLAVTHHIIVQLAAEYAGVNRKSVFRFKMHKWGFKWYDGYELLGDDIILFDKDVAAQYLIFMEKLGVPINLSKSVVSSNETFEFAKVTGHKGHFVSAISWKMLISQNTMLGRVNIAFSLLSKSVFDKKIISWLHHVMRRKYSEGDRLHYLIGIATMLVNGGKISLLDVLRCMDSDQIKEVTYKAYLSSFSQKKLEGLISSAFLGKSFDLGTNPFWDEFLQKMIWAYDPKLVGKVGNFIARGERNSYLLALNIFKVISPENEWFPRCDLFKTYHWTIDKPFKRDLLLHEYTDIHSSIVDSFQLLLEDFYLPVYRDLVYWPHNPTLSNPSPRGDPLKNNPVDITVEHYLQADEALRTVLTLEQLPQRAIIKASGINPATKVYFDSPLKFLKVLLLNSKKVILRLGKKRDIINSIL